MSATKEKYKGVGGGAEPTHKLHMKDFSNNPKAHANNLLSLDETGGPKKKK